MTIVMHRRRWYAAPAVAVAALLALVGCSAPSATGAGQSAGASSDASASAASSDLLPPAEGKTTYPLTVTSAVGEIVIPERPDRIAMASSWDGDLFAALRVVPVATDEQIKFYPWAVEQFPVEIETLWPVSDEAYPAETIATTSPQLIVDTLATDAAEVQKISAIAPVLGAPEATGEDSTWRDRLLLLGDVLDLSGRAQQVIDDYDASFARIRAEHPEFAGKTVDYVAFYGSEYGAGLLNTAGSDAEGLFSSLGLAPNPNAGNTAFDDAISDELWGTLTGDVLIISNQDAEGFAEFFANPLIQGLESVQSGRVIVLDVDSKAWTVSHDGELTEFTGHFGRAFNYGPLAHLELADLLVPLIADVLGSR